MSSLIDSASANRRRSAWHHLYVAITLAACTGCAQTRFGWYSPLTGHVKKKETAVAAKALPTSADDAEPEVPTPSAVEAFLRRTQQYDSMPEAQTEDVSADGENLADSAELGTDERKPPAQVSVGDQLHTTPRDATSSNAPAPKELKAIPVLLSVTVSAFDDENGAEYATVTRTANQPLDVTLPAPAARAGLDFVDELVRVARAQNTLAAWWQAGLASLAVNRPITPELENLPEQSDIRQLYQHALDVIQTVRRATLDPMDSGHEAVRTVDRLLAAVAERADPVVPHVALCWKVATFGVYEEIAPSTLLAGRPIQAIVYSEIENLSAERTDEGRYRTSLATRIEVFSTDGESMWMHEAPEIVDTCRRHRRDFFVAQRVTLPPTFPPGTYVLKVTVEDKHSARAAEGKMDFSITSPTSVASSD